MADLTPIQRKQRALYGDPLGLAHTSAIRRHMGLGGFGTVKTAASGAAAGASTGATVGSVVPIIGTAIGAVAGAIGGAIAGALAKRKDPENANLDQAIAMWNNNRLSVLNIANKYLVLAGMFDLNIKTNIPIYKRYGHMGEQKFVTDFVNLIYQAAQNGKITAADTPQTIMVNVVQPWIDSWGFGPMADPHADMINLILMGMIADYVAGNQRSWLARGGDYPFASLPAFSLPSTTGGAASTASTAAQYAATSTVSTAPLSSITAQTSPVVAITQMYSTQGAMITVGVQPSTTALQDSAGNIVHFAAPTSGATTAALIVNGNTTSQNAASAAIYNGHIYVRPAAGGSWGDGATTYLYSNGAWTQVADPFVSSSITTTASIPSGYSLIGTANGANAYQGADGYFYSWTGSAMTPITGTVTASNGTTANVVAGVAQASTSTSTTVSVPAGYTLIGTANGLSAYQGLDGNYYSWNGATMSLLTGTLTATNGQSAYISNGAVQSSTSLSTGAQQTQALTYSAPAGGGSTDVPQSAQTSPATPPATAGVSTTGLPSWLTWGAIAAGAYFMFATARPAGKIKMPRSRK